VASPKASLYRLHRDTRFSADKSPFKTQVGAVFPHRALPRHQGAGLYLEIGPAGTMIAGGIYMIFAYDGTFRWSGIWQAVFGGMILWLLFNRDADRYFEQ